MVVKTSGWGVADLETRRLWAETEEAELAEDLDGEFVADLEGEMDDDYVATDAEFLASELAAIDGELAALRAYYRICARYLLDPDPARRDAAGRKAAAVLREAVALDVARVTIALAGA